MAKFLKSIFNPTEKRKAPRHDAGTEDEKVEEPPMDGRRKLSISRSGRMKQANRKRHSLSLDLYGENVQNTCSTEKPKATQVDGPTSAPADIEGDRQSRRRSADDYNEPKVIHSKTVDVVANSGSQSKHRRLSVEPKSPEEEIDSAFEIIDKS